MNRIQKISLIGFFIGLAMIANLSLYSNKYTIYIVILGFIISLSCALAYSLFQYIPIAKETIPERNELIHLSSGYEVNTLFDAYRRLLNSKPKSLFISSVPKDLIKGKCLFEEQKKEVLPYGYVWAVKGASSKSSYSKTHKYSKGYESNRINNL